MRHSLSVRAWFGAVAWGLFATSCVAPLDTEAMVDDGLVGDERVGDVALAACASSCYQDGTKEVIIGCDDRELGPTTPTGAAASAPWRFTGKFTTGCTGALIGDRWVLTAAHCVPSTTGPVGFSLAQTYDTPSYRPFGTHTVRRFYYPKNIDPATIPQTEEAHAYDYAVAELANPIAGASPGPWGYMPWSQLKTKQVRSVGYPGSQNGSVWSTGAQDLLPSQPFKSTDGGAAGLLYTELDAEGGQSGSPVYVFTSGGHRKIIGVLVGAPLDACQDGENWVARINPDTVEHIENLWAPNTIDFFWRNRTFPLVPDAPQGGTWP